MKTLLIISICLSMNISAKRTAYHVIFDNGNGFEKVNTESITEVYTVLNLIIPGNCINIETELKSKKPAIELKSGEKYIYIEEKEVKRVKNNGELILKRIKKKSCIGTVEKPD